MCCVVPEAQPTRPLHAGRPKPGQRCLPPPPAPERQPARHTHSCPQQHHPHGPLHAPAQHQPCPRPHAPDAGEPPSRPVLSLAAWLWDCGSPWTKLRTAMPELTLQPLGQWQSKARLGRVGCLRSLGFVRPQPVHLKQWLQGRGPTSRHDAPAIICAVVQLSLHRPIGPETPQVPPNSTSLQSRLRHYVLISRLRAPGPTACINTHVAAPGVPASPQLPARPAGPPRLRSAWGNAASESVSSHGLVQRPGPRLPSAPQRICSLGAVSGPPGWPGPRCACFAAGSGGFRCAALWTAPAGCKSQEVCAWLWNCCMMGCSWPGISRQADVYSLHSVQH